MGIGASKFTSNTNQDAGPENNVNLVADPNVQGAAPNDQGASVPAGNAAAPNDQGASVPAGNAAAAASNDDESIDVERRGNVDANTKPEILDPTNEYGNVNFISFIATIYSRLAYMDDHKFLLNYAKIFGPIITDDIMKAINNQINKNGIRSILDDAQMFGIDVPTDALKGGADTSADASAVPTSADASAVPTPADASADASAAIQDSGTTNAKFGLDTYVDNENKGHLQFLPLAAKVNIALGESPNTDKTPNCQIEFENIIPNNTNMDTSNIIFNSVASSNYGEIYIIGDKRMPDLITVAFRGAYSGRTVMSFMQVSSVAPIAIGIKGQSPNSVSESYLLGVLKILAENIHSIVNSIAMIGDKLKAYRTDNSSKIRILTTGHSLGGGLCTIFAYLWVAHIKSKSTSSKPDQQFLSYIDENIACISIGAPRVFGKSLADFFCCLTNNIDDSNGDKFPKKCKTMLDKIQQIYTPSGSSSNNGDGVEIVGRITYIRLTNYHDKVPGLPLLFYTHPCSVADSIASKLKLKSNADTESDSLLNIRPSVTTDCYVQMTGTTGTRCATNGRPSAMIDLDMPLACVNSKEARKKQLASYDANAIQDPVIINPDLKYNPAYALMMYLGIGFAGVISVELFGKSFASKNWAGLDIKTKKTTQKFPAKTETQTRIISFPKDNEPNKDSASVLFFITNQTRAKTIELRAAESSIQTNIDNVATNPTSSGRFGTSMLESSKLLLHNNKNKLLISIAKQTEDVGMNWDLFTELINGTKETYNIFTAPAPMDSSLNINPLIPVVKMENKEFAGITTYLTDDKDSMLNMFARSGIASQSMPSEQSQQHGGKRTKRRRRRSKKRVKSRRTKQTKRPKPEKKQTRTKLSPIQN